MLIKANEKHRFIIMDYCKSEPSINLFIMGDIENFGFDSEFQDVWMQELNDKLVGVVLRYHDNFIVYSKDLDMDIEEVNCLLSKMDSKVISGKLSVINLLYPLVAENYNKKEMFFCELKDGSSLRKEETDIVVAEYEDAMEIAETYGLIEEFKGMYSEDVQERYKQISTRIKTKEGIHMFMKENGKIISHGNTTAETSVAGMIGGIFTLPEYRNNGLGSKMVGALASSLISRGKSACLFFNNPDAGKIYYKLGFKNIDKWAILGRK